MRGIDRAGGTTARAAGGRLGGAVTRGTDRAGGAAARGAGCGDKPREIAGRGIDADGGTETLPPDVFGAGRAGGGEVRGAEGMLAGGLGVGDDFGIDGLTFGAGRGGDGDDFGIGGLAGDFGALRGVGSPFGDGFSRGDVGVGLPPLGSTFDLGEAGGLSLLTGTRGVEASPPILGSPLPNTEGFGGGGAFVVGAAPAPDVPADLGNGCDFDVTGFGGTSSFSEREPADLPPAPGLPASSDSNEARRSATSRTERAASRCACRSASETVRKVRRPPRVASLRFDNIVTLFRLTLVFVLLLVMLLITTFC
jgi:hypothetical protein